MKVTWRGVKEFDRWLEQTPGIVTKDVAAALFQEGENIMAVSKRRTPVDTGNLRSSGHVKPPKTKGGETEVMLAYGTDYAIYVHEILTATHPSGQAKYLESAVKEAAGAFTANVKKRIRESVTRRGGI